jgi:predicted dehydrogenase
MKAVLGARCSVLGGTTAGPVHVVPSTEHGSEATMVRIGVVGAGWFASRRHLPDILACPEAELVALCRRSPDELALLARQFHANLTFTAFGRMLDEAPLDALLVATPHALHFPHAKAALERGLHVLVEKPLAVTAAQAEELAALAAARGRVLSTAVNPPFWAHCAYLKRFREQGALGEIEAAHLTMVGSVEHVFGRAPMPDQLPGLVRPTLFRADPALNGGGNLMDSGSHLVSELLWVTGLVPRAVTARMDAVPTDMRAVLTVELAGAAHPVLATITVVGDSHHARRRVQNNYYGSHGTAGVEGLPFRITLTPADGSPETLPETTLPPVPSPVADFVAAIREGRQPASPPAHGVAVTRVLEAAYRSATCGERIGL